MVVSVADISLNPKSHDTLAKLSIKPYVKVFMDTVAVIATEGITGRVNMCDYEPI
jgi:ABC-type transporter Mla subunit MlaD